MLVDMMCILLIIGSRVLNKLKEEWEKYQAYFQPAKKFQVVLQNDIKVLENPEVDKIIEWHVSPTSVWHYRHVFGNVYGFS